MVAVMLSIKHHTTIGMMIIISTIGRQLCANAKSSSAFNIRHYGGKCAEFNENQDALVFKSVCREQFRWDKGARLVHVPTNKCVVPVAKASGSSLGLTYNCSGTDTLLTHLAATGSIKHLLSGKCIQPKADTAEPADNTKLDISEDCSSIKTQFWFVKNTKYVIRHASGLCWVYSSSEDLMKLIDTFVCDRFEQANDKHLKHVATGKCVVYKNDAIRLISDCTSTASLFDLGTNNLLQQTTSLLCAKPHSASSPSSGDKLVLSPCSDQDHSRFYFHDEQSKHDFFIVRWFILLRCTPE